MRGQRITRPWRSRAEAMNSKRHAMGRSGRARRETPAMLEMRRWPRSSRYGRRHPIITPAADRG
jgi:hypothetical protein